MKRNLSLAYYASQDGKGGSSHYAVKDGEKTICRTTSQVATEQDEKMMRLFTAAPELLEASTQLLLLLGLPRATTTNADEARFVRMLSAAIAKARHEPCLLEQS
jgi:hypothetical protein